MSNKSEFFYTYLSLGSNIGDRKHYLKNALESIEIEIGLVTKKSNIYETAAWGFTNQPAFLNQVIEVKTKLNPAQLLKICLQIEKSLGRTRGKIWSERTIDIDILFFDGQSVQLADLLIPHPYLHLRKFILVPMSEIAPDLVHPTLEKTISDLLQDCSDDLETKIFQF